MSAKFFVLSVALLAISHGVSASDYWSASGESLRIKGETGSWQSPDSSAQVIVGDDENVVVLNGVKFDVSAIYTSPLLSEVTWSPSLHGVFVNASDGGNLGTCQTRAFMVTSHGVREVPVAKLVAHSKGLKSDCEYLNLVSVAWLEDENALLAMEQVPPGCSNDSKAIVYVIDLKKRLVRETLTPKAAMARYAAALGPRTKLALDRPPNS